MSKHLRDSVTSNYIEAANKLNSKKAKRRIVAYVESYEDIFFWRTVLGRFEDETRYFEVMLPSKGKLERGKKSVLMSHIVAKLAGKDMLACVDADYDYLLQGATNTSNEILKNPYVLHTYVYSIENYQCYAPSLHNVCVMVTLNDHNVFDFNAYLQLYSQACFPLFVWSIWAYRTGHYGVFSISDFCRTTDPGGFNIDNPMLSINNLRRKVARKVKWMEQQFPKDITACEHLANELLTLGITPQTTYLFIQGHHLCDTVVIPIMNKICNRLRQEREREIYSGAIHRTQMRNELSCYENSINDIRAMLKRNTGYERCPQFERIMEDVKAALKISQDMPQNKVQAELTASKN